MSNHPFSYELDERQIRILMKDAEVPYHEDAWKLFEASYINEIKSTESFINHIPKFNLSISRSIIVPIIFVFFIGGLSALLFSFVDFKKKENVVKENQLYTMSPKVPKKEVTRTTNPVKPKAKTVLPATTVSVSTSPGIVVKREVEKVNLPAPVKPELPTVKAGQHPPTESPKINITASIQQTATANTPVIKRLKRKAVQQPEELPIINTPARVITPTEEPELDLK